ncbi:IS200/IS605 family transposase [bacterium]|nr:IS200/IS605 family transposase [bacterium]
MMDSTSFFSNRDKGAMSSQPGAQPQVRWRKRYESAKGAVHLNSGAQPPGKETPMPESLSLVIVHVIFSTKNRHPFLDQDSRSSMHAYLATIARDLNCECYRVGGVMDHVHIAIRLSRTITIAQLVERLKTSSSKWAKEQYVSLRNFSWQRGYGCFSISPRDLDALRTYIDGQEEHHRKRTFQEEFRMFLEKYNVKYNEAYVWD